MSQIDQMLQYFIMLTSQELKKSFDHEEAEDITIAFSERFGELFEQLKERLDFNETQLFHGINPIFVIALEEALPGKQGQKDVTIVTRLVLTIYKTMLEEMVLYPQRRNLETSKNPWATFVENTRKGNTKIYDNEYFQVKEIISTSEEFGFDLNRCIYQEIFNEFGRDDLGPVMCEYDYILADNVSKWVGFKREETIPTGSNKCTFRFFNIKPRFSDNPLIDNFHFFLNIIDESQEMLSKQELVNKGLDVSTDVDEMIKLYRFVKNHSGIETLMVNKELAVGNLDSYKKHEEWILLFNRKVSKDIRSQIIRHLPLNLSEEKIKRLITDILENPYELDSIKWICLNYLQHHFSSRIGFEVEGVDQLQMNVGLLEQFRELYPDYSFEVKVLQNLKVSVQIFGKGIPEYKLKEPIGQIRKKIINNYPDAGISSIQPIISSDPVAQKFFEVFKDTSQSFQLRELALRILISRVGSKLIPFLVSVAENDEDDQFLRGRAIDSLSWFTSTLPQIYTSFEDFVPLPNPIKRSIIDFVSRQGIEQELLLFISKDESIDPIIRIIALRNLQTYQSPQVTTFLLEFTKERLNSERVRQASLEALSHHEVDEKGKNLLYTIFTDPKETTFIRMEALETLKALNFQPETETTKIEDSDWILSLGTKQLMEE